jgi:hypothetical protein
LRRVPLAHIMYSIRAQARTGRSTEYGFESYLESGILSLIKSVARVEIIVARKKTHEILARKISSSSATRLLVWLACRQCGVSSVVVTTQK